MSRIIIDTIKCNNCGCYNEIDYETCRAIDRADFELRCEKCGEAIDTKNNK
jgi:uncharacterized Zn finger protein